MSCPQMDRGGKAAVVRIRSRGAALESANAVFEYRLQTQSHSAGTFLIDTLMPNIELRQVTRR